MKKLITLLLSVCMVFTLVPMTAAPAYAGDPGVYVAELYRDADETLIGQYESLSAAFDAARTEAAGKTDNMTVKLIGDSTETDLAYLGDGTSVTLDLCGYTVTSPGGH